MAKTVHYLWEWGFVLEYKGIKRNFSISDDNLEDWHEAWVDCSQAVSIRESLDWSHGNVWKRLPRLLERPHLNKLARGDGKNNSVTNLLMLSE